MSGVISQMNGMKIYESVLCTEPEEYDRTRNWKERLFSWPWKPFTKTVREVRLKPMNGAYKHEDGYLVMHPEFARKLRGLVYKCGECQHVGKMGDELRCSHPTVVHRITGVHVTEDKSPEWCPLKPPTYLSEKSDTMPETGGGKALGGQEEVAGDSDDGRVDQGGKDS